MIRTGPVRIFPARLAMAIGVSWAAAASPAAAQDYALRELLIDGEGWVKVSEGHKFTEGPAVDAKGDLYFSDIPNNRIHKLDVVSGAVSVFRENTGGANGLMFDAKGRLLACQGGKGRVVAFNPDGTETEIASTGGKPNDLVIAPDGGIYFTDLPQKKVCRVAPDGKLTVLDDGLAAPNGLILLPDAATLVVADSLGRHLWTFPVRHDGTVGPRLGTYTLRLTAAHEKTGRSGADGMTVDSLGRLYVATIAGLQVFDPTGREVGLILKPTGHEGKPLSNVCFAGPGPQRDTLYVTLGDTVWKRKVRAAGVNWPGGARK
jgi:sugar lactone lactonase YvrE